MPHPALQLTAEELEKGRLTAFFHEVGRHDPQQLQILIQQSIFYSKIQDVLKRR